MKMDPQQEIFTEVLMRLRDRFDVYDGALPPEGTPYPFVYMGDASCVDVQLDKFAIVAEASLTVHVWHDKPDERGRFSAVLGEVKHLIRSIDKTQSYHWLWKDLSAQITHDDTTGRTLLHGIIDCKFEMIGY